MPQGEPREITTNVTAPEARERMSFWEQACQDRKATPERRTLARRRYLWWNKALLKMYVDGTKFIDASKEEAA